VLSTGATPAATAVAANAVRASRRVLDVVIPGSSPYLPIGG
jgi:hypothetical protein